MSETPRPRYAQVAPALPVEGVFDYEVPPELAQAVAIGKRVLIPFRTRKITGYVLELKAQPELDPAKIKPILQVLDQEPLFLPEQLALFRFCADYYQTPLGLVLKTALPPGINISSQKLVRITELGSERKSRLAEPMKSLLDLLDQFEELPVTRLESLLEAPVPDSMLKGLARKGLVEIIEEVEAPRIKPKEELAVRLKKTPRQDQEIELAKRAREQYRFLLTLKKGGVFLIHELRDQFKNPLALARGLEKRGLARIEKMRIERKPFALELMPIQKPDSLSPAQKSALAALERSMVENRPETFLLEGVTGSGKTEVYIQAAQMVLKRGKTALILVPEIALTPQFLHRFRSRFEQEKIAVLHSGLSPAERFDQWWQVRRGEAALVIGARSAIFAPVKNLGVIVVDEEQDGAYKQDHGVHYQARDLAVWRGRKENALVILGSATPSLESAFNAEQGKYKFLELPERIDSRPLPEVRLVDLRERRSDAREKTEPVPKALERRPERQLPAGEIISDALKQALLENFRRGNQSIIFLNRRGFAPSLICLDCGHQFLCPNCSVSYTWHQQRTSQELSPLYGAPPTDSYLLCHYCGSHQPAPKYCPNCLSAKVRDFGVGTERLEQELKVILPQAHIARMDRDTMSSRRAYFELISRMEFREIDVLVGTQMVAKGHDLPGVTLVGVVLADQSLNIPDFRSSEHTFQIITQVAGRSGRGDWPGLVIIQTFNPEHYAIKHALKHDYRGFYQEETALRKAFGYPPYSRIALLRLSGAKLETARKSSQLMGMISRKLKAQKDFKEIRILGPAAAPIFRLRARFRFQELVFSPNPSLLGRFTRALTEKFNAENSGSAGLRLELDRDPVSLL